MQVAGFRGETGAHVQVSPVSPGGAGFFRRDLPPPGIVPVFSPSRQFFKGPGGFSPPEEAPFGGRRGLAFKRVFPLGRRGISPFLGRGRAPLRSVFHRAVFSGGGGRLFPGASCYMYRLLKTRHFLSRTIGGSGLVGSGFTRDKAQGRAVLSRGPRFFSRFSTGVGPFTPLTGHQISGASRDNRSASQLVGVGPLRRRALIRTPPPAVCGEVPPRQGFREAAEPYPCGGLVGRIGAVGR